MSEKRFEVVMNEFDEVEYIMDKVAMEDRDFAEFIDFVEDICNENEQLKQFKKQVCNLIDTKIKHYEHKPISAPVSQPLSVNFDYDVDRLARLSELQDLKWELKSE